MEEATKRDGLKYIRISLIPTQHRFSEIALDPRGTLPRHTAQWQKRTCPSSNTSKELRQGAGSFGCDALPPPVLLRPIRDPSSVQSWLRSVPPTATLHCGVQPGPCWPGSTADYAMVFGGEVRLRPGSRGACRAATAHPKNPTNLWQLTLILSSLLSAPISSRAHARRYPLRGNITMSSSSAENQSLPLSMV